MYAEYITPPDFRYVVMHYLLSNLRKNLILTMTFS